MAKQFLRLRAVMNLVGLSRAQIYLMMRAGLFPQNVHVTTRAVAWDSEEVDAWMRARIEDSRASKG
jgi:prophage regulatory protein